PKRRQLANSSSMANPRVFEGGQMLFHRCDVVASASRAFEGSEYRPEARDMAVKYDLIVIGAGPAGEKGAAQAAYFGKRVALVERSPVFGGAVASTSIAFKALRETALYLAGFRARKLYGLDF